MEKAKNLIEKLDDVREFLRERCGEFPKVVVVLGSGLGDFADSLQSRIDLAVSDIPHFKSLSVEGHAGRLRIGTLSGTPIACLQGRLHAYEGHPLSDVVFPAQALGWAGGKVFVLTNASGGLREGMKPLDFLLVRDHINMTGCNPLVGKNFDTLGQRFPDMSNLYNSRLREIFNRSAKKLGIPLKEGVYLWSLGPSYETPAEVKMYRNLGADVVGMSTVPEAIALHHMGKKVVGISCITNLASGVTEEVLEHADVLANAKKINATFSRLMNEAIKEIGGELD
jgi:purine-nucleoside phosphorylase